MKDCNRTMNSQTQTNIETKTRTNNEMKSIHANCFRRYYRGYLATENTTECAIVLETYHLHNLIHSPSIQIFV